MKRIINRIVVGMISVMLLSTFGTEMKVSATQQGLSGTGSEEIVERDFPYIAGYEVTNGTITPGSEFTLTIQVRNMNGNEKVEGVTVVMTNPDGVIPEYGTISQGVISTIYPGGTENISFKYSAVTPLNVSYLNFTVYVGSRNGSTSAQIRVPVGRVTDFSVEEVSVPKVYSTNRAEYISAMINNVSNAEASNVKMIARSNGEEIASIDIGTLTAGVTKTQSLNVMFTEEGTYSLDTVLTYTDGNGRNKEYVVDSSNVTVSDEIVDSEGTDGTDSDAEEPEEDARVDINQGGMQKQTVVLFCSCGILLIAVCCVILLQIYKRK